MCSPDREGLKAEFRRQNTGDRRQKPGARRQETEDNNHFNDIMKSIFETYIRRSRKSKELYEKNLCLMPGGISHNVRFQKPYPFFVDRAEGCRVWDVDGNEYIDMWMGHYALILGHSHPLIMDALQEILKKGVHWGISNPLEVELAKLIVELVPCAERIRFCCSGTEANMYAVRMARAFTGKPLVLKAVGGWHGPSTDLSYDIFPPFEGREGAGLPPEMEKWVGSFPFNDIKRTERIIDSRSGDTAAVIVEPMMGSAGFLPADREYLLMLREKTKKIGAILIFDEIITGFRIGIEGAQGHYGILPDLVTLGKIIGGGMPIGAVAGRSDILDTSSLTGVPSKSRRALVGGGTFSCHPMAMAAGIRTLEILKEEKEKIYTEIARKGDKLREGLKKAFEERGIPVCITGLHSCHMIHFTKGPDLDIRSPEDVAEKTMQERLEEYQYRMRNEGVFMVHGAGALSIAHGDEDIEAFIDSAKKVAKAMKG
jgi:glutamate-1-semialdehyde 2,1-aminomutase